MSDGPKLVPHRVKVTGDLYHGDGRDAIEVAHGG
jgi:hypothetical protein